jgi:hypothetical protein
VGCSRGKDEKELLLHLASHGLAFAWNFVGYPTVVHVSIDVRDTLGKIHRSASMKKTDDIASYSNVSKLCT